MLFAGVDASRVASASALNNADFLFAVSADKIVTVETAIVEACDESLDVINDVFAAAASVQTAKSCEKGGITFPCRP